MSDQSWRFILQRVPSGEFVDMDLPLMNASISTAINAPGSITGTLPSEYASLVGPDGDLAIQEWGTMIHAELDGEIVQSAIVDNIEMDGDSLRLDAGGWSMIAKDTPWLGNAQSFVQVDPLTVLRSIWNHIQSYPDSNLGVEVDMLHSPVRVGTAVSTTEFTTGAGEAVSFESGPLKLNWWETNDLQAVIDELATNTPFQYMEHSYWEGEVIKHRLKLGYPTIGTRREHARFEIGLNVKAVPKVMLGDYASEVIVYGAGEGSSKVNGRVTAQTGRLRRVRIQTDKGLTSSTRATQAARPILDELIGKREIDSLTVMSTDLAPVGTYGPGDEIYVSGDTGWADLDMWVRISELTINPDNTEITLKVVTV